jgi:serine/threonine protein kinase
MSLIINSMLGAGTSSFVYCVNKTQAVKKFTSIDAINDVFNEKTIYQLLSPHPRLVYIYECGADFLIMDRMPNGDLARFMESHPEVAQHRKLQWVIQIAECFDLLHQHHVSHCDSKLENFLVDENYDLKICDFAGSHYYKAPSKGVAIQPSRYRRPIDDFNEEIFNPADDIFAFGSICYELITGKPLFPGLGDESVEHQINMGNFPETKDLCFGQVIEGCWHSAFTSFKAVLDVIKTEADQVKPV